MALSAKDVPDKSRVERLVEAIESGIDSEIGINSRIYKCVGGAQGNTFSKELYTFLGGWFSDSPPDDEEKMYREASSRLKRLYEQAGWIVEIRESKKRALVVTGVWEYVHTIVIRKA